MFTKLTVRNFKRFGEVEIDLANPVVFIGPNNSGKTSAMQALALWDIGLRRWNEKRKGRTAPEKRPGVTVNRRDLVAIPVPNANLLWRELHTRNVHKVNGRQRTDNIRVDVIVEGASPSRQGTSGHDAPRRADSIGPPWKCGLEFDYANQESFYCRPLRLGEGSAPERMPIPDEAGGLAVAYLPPMSGLAATETRLDRGAVNVRVGEGRTAEVLRNLCWQIHQDAPESWEGLCSRIQSLFGARLERPQYVEERGEITMRYRENGVWLDLSNSGRGLQQTMLILAYMHANPGSVLLLDEPDAHLEFLRQRQIYSLIREVAAESGSQIVAASHSEVLLNEAAGTDTVIAFVGKPHRIDDRGSQVSKALKKIGFEQYVQAEQVGWVLYLEGSTDFEILRSFAKRLGHEEGERVLGRPFVRYIGNQFSAAEEHYWGLREAVAGLRGVAVLDEEPSDRGGKLRRLGWRRREIENYFCTQATLENYVRATASKVAEGPLFEASAVERRLDALHGAIVEVESALQTLGRPAIWSAEVKASDDVLTPLFKSYFQKLNEPNLMEKTNFHRLAEFVPEDEIDSEVVEKLDAIVEVAALARPAGQGP